jgi:hypothetical protein
MGLRNPFQRPQQEVVDPLPSRLVVDLGPRGGVWPGFWAFP